MRRSIACGLAGLTLALAGCGAQPVTPSAIGSLADRALAASGRTTFLLVDGSSFRRFAPDYRADMTAVIGDVAARRGRVLAAIADGQPLTTARILTADFDAAPIGASDPSVAARFHQAKAIGLAGRLTRLVRNGQVVRGSGQLEALAVAANTPSLRTVVFWTDAVVNEPDGFTVTGATRQDVDRQVRRWAPRLRGLHGRTVVLLGVGRGVHRRATVERAHRLFAGLARAAHFRLFWAQSLAQIRE
jgi:hypothetical protein